ncbi:MAG: pyridoxine 5'-phosphate synthase [Verrucomicrobiota bacterium]|jgi:pyridoxine 5-phosphate synthase|nr:pyridoxine 5'-phosphate synthase [Verrucomicrobiales bacterium]MEC9080313.1 pyridoxine 5'-phosphate synthase [Verrucomicrobiota bacterium]MEE2942775.1 pyridoxine 5'-phosphate synthase [Verrucomicrobiota bacterium]
MLRLGVNIDHIATLRQARYRGLDHGEPCPVDAVRQAEAAGAHGITAHLREDRRHILDRDIWAIRETVSTRLNFEMANTPEMIDIALRLKPDAVCIVPENRAEVTTEGGLNVVVQAGAIADTATELNKAGIEVSLFIDPDPAQIEASVRTGSPFIELHTGAYSEAYDDEAKRATELQRLTKAAEQAKTLGIEVNAGHGLNYKNTRGILAVPHLNELNIGHSIVSRAVTVGLGPAVREMLGLIDDSPPNG